MVQITKTCCQTNHLEGNKILNKQKMFVVCNYFSITLNNDIENMLNRAKKCSILPLSLDITTILIDFNLFFKYFIWQKYWYRREPDNERKNNPFKYKNITYQESTVSQMTSINTETQ